MSKLLRHQWGLNTPPPGPFTINRDSPQADGLVLWMPHGGGDPGTSRHVDRVRGLTFTKGGTPTWVLDGERGWSMLFDDASSEYLETGHGVPTGLPLTISARFYTDRNNANQVIAGLADASLANGWHALWVRDNTKLQCFTFDTGDAQRFAESSAAVTINACEYGCGVWAASNDRRVYLNEAKNTDTADGAGRTLNVTSIARISDSSPGYYFSGSVYDLRIYNRALTDAEVWQIYDPATRWELYKPTRRLWQAVTAAPPPTAALPIFAPPDAIHSQVFGGVTVR